MGRRRLLGWVAAAFAVVAGALALWGQSVYQHTETVQRFYYAMQGYSSGISRVSAAQDAAQEAGPLFTMAWVCVIVAVAAGIVALATKNAVIPEAQGH